MSLSRQVPEQVEVGPVRADVHVPAEFHSDTFGKSGDCLKVPARTEVGVHPEGEGAERTAVGNGNRSETDVGQTLASEQEPE